MTGPVSSRVPGAPHKPPKGRSPSYPGISLRTAVERARILWERHRKHAAPLEAITSAWGYKSPTTGPASVAYAALKKFGLLEEEGSGSDRMARLTDLAVEILLNPDPGQAIQQAALLPPIHAEMWEQYGADLPPDDTLKWQLTRRGFTDTGFDEFIREYRETVTFAALEQAAHPGRNEVSTEHQSRVTHAYPADVAGSLEMHNQVAVPADQHVEPAAMPVHESLPQAATALRIPLVGGKVVILDGEFPISEAAWSHLLAVLEAMKPGLVVADPQPTPAG